MSLAQRSGCPILNSSVYQYLCGKGLSDIKTKSEDVSDPEIQIILQEVHRLYLLRDVSTIRASYKCFGVWVCECMYIFMCNV